MSLWKIAWRSIQQRALASTLTIVSMALGVMLVVAVLVAHGVINQSFMNNSDLGYNLVVGAKGGRLDLVLNSVYYLARPVENIPYTYYQEFAKGKYSQYVDLAIPVCLGDMYHDFRVVGTTPEFFDLEYAGKKYEFQPGGRNFKAEEYFSGVIGATVARETGLKVGDEFQPAHGAAPDAHVHDPFKVVGILKPTGTPNDRALFINMEGFYLIPEHARPTDEELAGETAHHDEADHDHEHPHDHADEEHHEHGEQMPADEAHADEDAEHHEHAHHKEPAAAAAQAAEHEEHEHADEPGKHADKAHAKGEPADHEHAEDAAHDHEHDHAEHADHDHDHHAHGDHEHEHSHEPLPLEKREVTAVLVALRSLPGIPSELQAPQIIKSVNKGNVAQAVLPIREMTVLFETFVDPMQWILLGLTAMIVVVSGIGILVSIYNSMSERQHEIAIVRALGAGRQIVMLLVLLESLLLSLMGGLAGWAVGHGLVALLSPWITTQTGVSIGFLQFVGLELVIIPALVALAAVVGFLPGLAAYRTDVAKALSANP